VQAPKWRLGIHPWYANPSCSSWRRANTDEGLHSRVSALQAALLGLLALLLGFTFSMALTRFDTRKELVLEEANAIGTTYLRARLLPPPHR